MMNTVLDVTSLVLLSVVLCHAGFLHMRLTRLRRALAEAGDVLPSVDAAVARLGDAASGFARRVQTDLEAVDGRLAGARRTATDLATASRAAEDLASQLERQVRQSRRLEGARAAAIPRELVEPKGFAERIGAAALEASRSDTVVSLPAPSSAPAASVSASPAGSPERVVRVNML
ncbi:protein of unknown function (plasmid) [Rhodovastum atsumiense]|uniref:hypothetical protein n=1 Tax=Rhodovastum atsumiense TaxID=504468 RepID=UPI0020246580|nr:hypothetical protein [Rhodovastum atsumiense]CAH2605535.1 protein of unknown function [Rhodovastum atsumiense]